MRNKFPIILLALFFISISMGLFSFFIVENERKVNEIELAKLTKEKKVREDELKISEKKIKILVDENKELQNMKNGD
ncbi:MAG: hypothetical protein KBF12_10215 [Sebaldella sp.]|nr:hypothetical protein [Sebaldella sp.]